ncbi:MAG: glycoside hydrolase domain-containing protein [Hyphomicrobiales bacterium]
MIIMDTPWSCARKARELKAAGVDVIIRYYNHRNSKQLPEKRLSRSEAEAITAAGMRLGVVFQQRQNKLRDFTFDKGRAAGERAFALAAQDILQPFGSAIYFGVDWDFFRTSELKQVAGFFEGVRAAFQTASAGGQSYRVGAYGSGTVLSHLGSKGLAELFWLSQSTGWSGYKAFRKSDRWHLLQGPVTSIEGIDCDTNRANPEHPDYGAFDLTVAEASGIYRVIARSGLNLRQGPGVEFPVVQVLPFGSLTKVLRHNGDWAQVDLQADGKADGHVHASFLQHREGLTDAALHCFPS